jgi:hypothetical protein
MTAASNTDGAAVSIQACTGAASQQWSFKSGQVQVFGNKCLDVKYAFFFSSPRINSSIRCFRDYPELNFFFDIGTGSIKAAQNSKSGLALPETRTSNGIIPATIVLLGPIMANALTFPVVRPLTGTFFKSGNVPAETIIRFGT